jgi:plasmid stabilization system protein ParE
MKPLGKPRPDVKSGYRAFQPGKYMIFYRVGQEFLDIIGILHIRMDPGRRFGDG